MEFERDVLVSPTVEVPVIEGELVGVIRELAGRGLGSKTIARTVGVSRNTVRRYLRHAVAPGVQVRPTARRLTDDGRRDARTLYEGVAGGNAVVVQRLLTDRGVEVSVRTIERSRIYAGRARSRRSRRCAWRVPRAISSKLTSASSGSTSPAQTSASLCSSRS